MQVPYQLQQISKRRLLKEYLICIMSRQTELHITKFQVNISKDGRENSVKLDFSKGQQLM